jgi:biotin synthase
MFDRLLETAQKETLTHELALKIYEESRDPENARKLFQVASALRDKHIGRDFWWTAAINGILPCKITPMCGYCSYSNQEKLSNEQMVKVLKALEGLGFKHLHISGGANLAGYDAEILSMVEAMRAVSDIAIEVNVGPSLGRETVRRLKDLKVSSITSSLETINEEVFKKAKPGDSLEKRKALLEMCEEEGMPTRGMLLIGLGESNDDRIRQLFYLKGLKGMSHIRFSRFNPPAAARYSNHPRCSPWEVARIIAVARLIMPEMQLGLAAGNSHDDIPLWFLAGGGNQLLGASALRKSSKAQSEADVIQIEEGLCVVSRTALLERYVRGMGLKVGFDCPPNA